MATLFHTSGVAVLICVSGLAAQPSSPWAEIHVVDSDL